MPSPLNRSHIVLLAAVLICLTGAYLLRDAGIDDVGVSYRYARHLADGDGLNWNPGEEPVEGYSNLSWVLILAGGHLLGADIEIFSRLLGLLLGIGTLYLTHRLVSSLDPESRSPFLSTVPVLVALTPTWLMWIMSGLEIALYGFLLVLAVHSLTMTGARKTAVMSVALSLLVLTRPEGIGLVGTYMFVAWLLRNKTQKTPLAGLAIPLFAVIATGIGVTIFRLAYYGYPLPNTVYAKFSTLFPSAGAVGRWLLYAAPFLILWAISARWWWRSNARLPMLTAIALVLTQTIQVLPVNPVMHFLHRYTIAFVPLLYLAVPFVLNRLAQRAQVLAWAGTLLLAAWLLQDWPAVMRFYDANAFNVRRQECVVEKLAGLGGRPRIALLDAGRIPYLSDLPAIDLGGLCDRRIGHYGLLVSYVLDHPAGSPDVVVMAIRSVPDGYELPFGADRAILADTSFQSRYRLRIICDADEGERPTSTDPFRYLDYGIYLKRDYPESP